MENVRKIIKIVIIVILALWMLIFIVDYFRAKSGKHPLICISETRKDINGNSYYACTSFGYKYYVYQEKTKEGTRETFGFNAAFLKNDIEKQIEETK